MSKDYALYVCAHKPLENNIPKGNEYIIIAQKDSIKSNEHSVIYLTDDEFTKKHWRCYGEGCAMRYLWKHPEILPKYVGINHYRRFFLDFTGMESKIPSTLNKYKAIVAKPFVYDKKRLKTNLDAQTIDHFADDSQTLREVIADLYPDFSKVYEKELLDDYFHPCNIFVMRKEDFLEMCEICFTVLEEFDRRMGYTDNDAVYRKVLHYGRRHKMFIGVEWQARLQGFYLEWLTDTYYKYKFGDNMYIASFGLLPDNYGTGVPYKNIL